MMPTTSAVWPFEKVICLPTIERSAPYRRRQSASLITTMGTALVAVSASRNARPTAGATRSTLNADGVIAAPGIMSASPFTIMVTPRC
jgi:hypothetical protein